MNAKQKTHAIYAVVATALAITGLAASQAEADQIIRDDGSVVEVGENERAIVIPGYTAGMVTSCQNSFIVPAETVDNCEGDWGSKGCPNTQDPIDNPADTQGTVPAVDFGPSPANNFGAVVEYIEDYLGIN
jgi:hypothetical protein